MQESCTIQDNTSHLIRKELNIHWNYKIQTTQNNHRDICQKNRQEKSNIQIDARRSANKNDAEAPYNRTSESHVTEHTLSRSYAPTLTQSIYSTPAIQIFGLGKKIPTQNMPFSICVSNLHRQKKYQCKIGFSQFSTIKWLFFIIFFYFITSVSKK